MVEAGRRKFFVVFSASMLFISCVASVSFIQAVYPVALASFTVPCTIDTYGNAWQGVLAFGLFQTNQSNGPTGSYLVIMDTNGTVEYYRYTTDQSYEVVKYVAPDTLMFTGEPVLDGASDAPILATHFWNYVTNTTENFPGVQGHHDIDYDPVNNTFLTLEDYVRNVDGTDYLCDKIVEFNATGSVLWSWDTYGHIPISEANPTVTTAVIDNETVVDFTHANAIDWDYNDSIIYLNCRFTNTFYKIDQNTGDIIWACGQFGNFKLIGDNGQQVSSLWYGSHGTYQVAPDVFIMFDNDFLNETNPDDCHSRMIEVTVNEQNMTAWVSWSWEAPTQYWTPYWGIVDRLPNGDRIGVFGTTTHEFAENNPWDFTDTGAVLVEVNQTGSVVRTYTFPEGWGIYRIIELPSQAVPEYGTPELTFAVIASSSLIVVVAVIYMRTKKQQEN